MPEPGSARPGRALLGGAARARHRPHRLQGGVAEPLARGAGRTWSRATRATSRPSPRSTSSPASASSSSTSTGTSATASASPRRSRGCARRSCCTWRPSRSCAARSATPSRPTRPTSWAPSTCSTPCAAPATASASSINVSSDKCYENREWVWGYREDEPMGGHDPYSSSKGCAELVTAAYRALVLRRRRRARRRQRAGRQRLRRRRLGRGPPAARRLARRPRRRAGPHPQPRGDPPVAARAQPAERLPAPRRARVGRPRGAPAPGTSAPPTATRGRCAGSSSASASCGPARCAGRPTPARIRTRRTGSSSTLRWPVRGSTGRPAWDLAAGLEQTVAWYRAYRVGADVRDTTLEQVREFAA